MLAKKSENKNKTLIALRNNNSGLFAEYLKSLGKTSKIFQAGICLKAGMTG